MLNIKRGRYISRFVLYLIHGTDYTLEIIIRYTIGFWKIHGKYIGIFYTCR